MPRLKPVAQLAEFAPPLAYQAVVRPRYQRIQRVYRPRKWKPTKIGGGGERLFELIALIKQVLIENNGSMSHVPLVIECTKRYWPELNVRKREATTERGVIFNMITLMRTRQLLTVTRGAVYLNRRHPTRDEIFWRNRGQALEQRPRNFDHAVRVG